MSGYNDESGRAKFIRFAIAIGIVGVILTGVFYFLIFRLDVFNTRKTYSVAVVLGAHKNSREINLNPNPELESRILRAIDTDGYIAVTVADGRPADQAAEFNYGTEKASPMQRIIDPQGMTQIRTNRLQEVYNHMASARAVSPEVDLLAALKTAARQLQTRQDDEIKEIIVLGTGLSTTGFVNLAENESEWLYRDAEELVGKLIQQKDLPDFTGIHVVWCHIHDVDGVVQEEFSGLQKNNLEQLWKMIIENGGGTMELSPIIAGRGIYGDLDLPHVTACTVRKAPVIAPPQEETLTPPDEVGVLFMAESDTFINVEDAKAAAQKWVSFIKQQGGVYLFGCTAKTDSWENERQYNHVKLSNDRANAVKALLVKEFGISEDKIITRGLGYDNPWHKYNGEEGIDWNQIAAQENRKVVIMALTDEDAKNIYNGADSQN